MVRWSGGPSVSQSIFLSFCHSFFLSFRLSSPNFILVFWQADTGMESFFELTRVDKGIHFRWHCTKKYMIQIMMRNALYKYIIYKRY